MKNRIKFINSLIMSGTYILVVFMAKSSNQRKYATFLPEFTKLSPPNKKPLLASYPCKEGYVPKNAH